MANALQQALSLLSKGMELSKTDTDKIAELQAETSASEFAAFGDIWEGVSLIINNPYYRGTAYIPDEDIIPKGMKIEKLSLEIGGG
ncbi:hypothetical protein SXAG_00161 [Synechococcus phage S-CBS4]|nr:hypothetical protein SXAG_00161 [Synechococcus phage S-CBS4]